MIETTKRGAQANYLLLLTALATGTLVMLAASIAIGYAPLNMAAATADWFAGRDTLPALVLVQLRLPRALVGALVG